MRCYKLPTLAVALVMLCIATWAMAGSQTLNASKSAPHNLNNLLGTGGTNLNPGGDTEICLPCHTPHATPGAVPSGSGTVGTSGLLWNHQVDMTKTYTMYTVVQPVIVNGTTTAQPSNAQLDTTSRLCLSCHDGAIAVDSYGGASGTLMIGTLTSHGASAPGAYQIAAGGTDLSADHPVGVPYPGLVGGVFTADPSNQFNDPTLGGNFTSGGVGGAGNISGGPGVKLVTLADGVTPGVGCGTCHEPHNANYWYLRMSNTGSAMCLTCHNK